jgi:glycosyltransferase involved in cell wall biosynthesis
MIESGKTGLLVPPHDAPALGNAIALLLTDHPLADMLARAGHDYVVANFSIVSMVNAVSRIYEEGAAVVASRSGATLTAA